MVMPVLIRSITDNNNTNGSSQANSDYIQEQNISVQDIQTTQVTHFASDAPTQVGFLHEAEKPTFLATAPENSSLGDFLSRPVLTNTYSWTTAAPLNLHVDPWASFLNNASVVNKTTNFCMIRGDLHVEVQCNGTPFHFGSILVSYEPMNGLRHSIDGDYRQHSNLQHGFLDPCLCTSVSLTCPFIRPDNWIHMMKNTGAQVGVLNLDTIVNLGSASSVVDVVTVNVYCWMTNVELAYPTSVSRVAFTPQSKRVVKKKRNAGSSMGKDEYEVKPNSGLISRPAAAIAAMATTLTEIPIIGPFATAASIGAGATAAMASLFGYSRPLSLTAPETYLNLPSSVLAATDQVSNALPLTVSSKSQISIDPRIVGLTSGEDELTILSIAQKPTLMGVIPWDVGNFAGTVLATIPIQPMSQSTSTGAAGAAGVLSMSALAFASLPFSYWNGTLKFRFKVVCSKYHRGRLRFCYSPDNSFTGTGELNNSYNHIVDITPGKEFEVIIPWAQAQPMLPIPLVADATAATNGVLTINVQNELTTPDSVTPIQVQVWIYAGDDYRVAVPTSFPYQTLYLNRQSDTQGVTNEEIDCEVIQFFNAVSHPQFDAAIISDPIRSFRPLLKRYTQVASTNPQTANVALVGDAFCFRELIFPLYPQRSGTVTYGSNQTVTGNFNMTFNHLANYLEPSFLCKKGGFRWLADTNGAVLFGHRNTSSYQLGRRNTDDVRIEDTLTQSGTALTGCLSLYSSAMNEGTLTQDVFTGKQLFQPGVTGGQLPEVELPYYTPFRYSTHFGSDTDPYYPREGGILRQISLPDSNFSTAYPINIGNVGLYASAAEDFTMHVFLGVPKWISTDLSTPFAPGLAVATDAAARTTPFPGE